MMPTVERWTYMRRIGGLMRCCLGSLDEEMLKRMEAKKGPPTEGDTFTTTCCETPLIHRNGAWEWSR